MAKVFERWHILQNWIMWAQLSDSKNTFSPNSSDQNDFFQENWVVRILSPLHVGKIWAYIVRYYCPNNDFRCQLACYGPNHTSKCPSRVFLFYQKLRLLKIFRFLTWLRFSRYGFFAILKYVKKLGGIHFFSSTCGQNMSLYGHRLRPKQWL